MAVHQVDSVVLSERYLLPPDDGAMEGQIESLYPANGVEQKMFDFVRPDQALFEPFFPPPIFCRVFSGLLSSLGASGIAEGVAASQQLQEMEEAGKLMGMIKHLLHKV
ncbi:hypothetical protein ACU5P1_16585 [Pseudomonas plecoglossicida]|uniref:type III secretion apparatus assembly protein SctX n=1 Tax=Pseudomonas plecoglossicida TaxID=70775 RepID=UPI00138E3E3B|nr:hypothetical protein [Pseudomonas plecoglossicida]QLB56288.1 hypothetical protein HAV28_16415 [Pseudomonas plecoglossicida]